MSVDKQNIQPTIKMVTVLYKICSFSCTNVLSEYRALQLGLF